MVTQRRRSGASNISHNSSSNRHQWWCHLSKDAYCVQQQQQCRRSSSVDKRPTDQPTSDSDGRNGSSSSHLRMYLLLHTFDAVCLLYAQICVEMHTSLCTPISWDLMLDPCEWFSKSLSRRLKPQLTSSGVRVCRTYIPTYCCVTVSAQNLRVYIFSYISLVVYLYIYMLGQKTWNISNHADPIEVVTKNEDIIADQNASG